MKRIVYIFSLLSFLNGCRHERKPDFNIEDAAHDIIEENNDTISKKCTAEKDENMLVQQWFYTFNEKDSIPNRWYEETGLFFMHGFCVDSDGMLYFASGSPAQIACFNGSKLVYRKVFKNCEMNFDLFRLVRDTLFFVEPKHGTLFSIHKSGNDTLHEHKLPIDNIVGGWMTDNEIIIQSKNYRAKDSLTTCRQFHCTYSGVTLDSIECVLGEDRLKEWTYSPFRGNKTLENCDHAGRFRGYEVFYYPNWTQNEMTIYFVDSLGRIAKEYNYMDTLGIHPPFIEHNVGNIMETHSHHFSIAKKGLLYTIGYIGDKEKAVVSRFNLEKVLHASTKHFEE